MKLLDKQENAVFFLKDNQTNEVIYGGAAGGGKSALGCSWLIEQCQAFPESRWLMGRSKLKTLKETTLNTFFQLATKFGISDQYRYNDQKSIIYWNNGSEILLKDLFRYPSDPEFDSLGSLEITGAFVDECNQIESKAFKVVRSRCRYLLNEYKKIPKVLGTCNPSKNWVYKDFYKPFRDGNLLTNRAFIQALPTDNPHLPKSYLQSLLSLDENSIQRLYYGNWEYDDDPAKLIEYDRILDCFTNDFVESGEKYITGDIARQGKDKSVVGVWNGWRLEQIHVWPKNTIDGISREIDNLALINAIPKSNIIVDEDGVGGGVVDILKCKGFVNNSTPLDDPNQKVKENYNNLKSQCYFGIAKKINATEVYICPTQWDNLIVQELEQVKRHNADKDGKLQLIPKEMFKEVLGRSPDFSDMIAMRKWFDYKKQLNFAVWID
jgi:phage terminase large subunit